MSDGSDERRAPSASGTLAARPLVHLLVYARNRRLTGRLELHAADGRSGSVGLWRGNIEGARTSPPIAYFGAIAYELGHIDNATLDATLLEIAKTKRLHGDVLVERGSLTTVQRDAILTEQACRKIHHLFALPPDSSFAFYDEPPSASEPPFTLDPIRPAWLGLRTGAPVESVREVLARYASASFRMTNDGPLLRAGFDPEETAVCDALGAKSMTATQLRAKSSLPAEHVDRLLYLLIITKCAEPIASSPSLPAVGSQPAFPAAPAIHAKESSSDSGEMRRSLSFRVPSAPAIRASVSLKTHEGPPSSSPRLAAAPAVFGPADLGAVGIAHRATTIDGEDPFTALGLREGASAEAARAAYFRLAKLWHPDKLPEDLAPFRAEAMTIFEHLSRAHHTLTDADARNTYLTTGRTISTSSVPAAKRPRKEILRAIEHAIARREFQTAEDAARELAATDADDVDAQALAAWASTHAGEAPEDTLRNALSLLDRAVHRDQGCERAHFFRGQLHKRVGNHAAAFRDFTRVTHLNPKNVDAQREIRIYEMRARKGSGEHALDAMIKARKK